MRVGIRTLALLLVLAVVPLTAHAWDRKNVETFATLPAGERHPEGVTADKRGNIYVTTFDIARAGLAGEVGHLLAYRNDGRLLRKVLVQNSSPFLLDLAFSPADPRGRDLLDNAGNVCISDSFQGVIWRTGPGGGIGGPGGKDAAR